jgi:hypothetical protein
VRRHAKASSAGSIFGRGSRSGLVRRALAPRDASLGADGSGAPAGSRARLLLLAALAALTALAMIPASASALLTRAELAFSPINGSGIGATLHFANGVTVDETTGNVFIGDGSGGNAIDITNAEGGIPVGVASPYSITGLHFNGEPIGMAIDNSASVSKGALYFTDVQIFPRELGLRKFVRNGGTETYESAPGSDPIKPTSGPQVNEPLGGTAVDNAGNVYFADWGSGSILEFSPTGTQLARINTQPSIGRPSSIALDNAGDLFVHPYSSGKVVKYPAASLGLGDITPATFEQVGTFFNARGLALDRATNRLFVGLGNHVAEYDAATLAKTGEFGEGAVNSISAVAVNSATGRIYVADNSSQKVAVFGAVTTVPDTTTGIASEIKGTTAVVEGVVNPAGIAITECKFQFGTTNAYGHEVPCKEAVPTDSADHTVTAELTGLTPNATLNHYRLVAANANGAHGGGDRTLVTTETVKTGNASNLTGTRARVEGTINPENIAITNCKFEYGLSSAYGKEVPCEATPPTDSFFHTVAANLTNLTPNGAIYHYRIVTSNASGDVKGQDKTFVTPDTVITGVGDSPTATTAVLHGTINPDTVPITDCHFEYVKDSDFLATGFTGAATVPCQEEVGEGTIPVDVSAVATGLVQSTDYRFRLVAANANGPIVGAASKKPFAPFGPQIRKAFVLFPSITSNSAVLVGVISPAGEGTAYHFEYVTQAQYENSGYAGATLIPSATTGIGNGIEEKEVAPELKGLTPETTYHARLVVTNPTGSVISGDIKFSTFPASDIGPCPNEELREGHDLPDCRAYEQASPTDKNGNSVGSSTFFHTQASADGDAVLYLAFSGLPGSVGAQSFPLFVSRRGPDSWYTRGTLPPPTFGNRSVTRSWTEDLSLAFDGSSENRPTGVQPAGVGVVRNLLNDTSQAMWSPHIPGGLFTIRYAGASNDSKKIFFEVEVESDRGVAPPGEECEGPTPGPECGMLPGIVGAPAAPGVNNLYEYDRDTGELTVAGILPADEGGVAAPEGAFTGSSSERFTQSENIVSDDGDTVFFEAGLPRRVYRRTGLNGPSPETTLVSKSRKTDGAGPHGTDYNGPRATELVQATPDGKKVFFVSKEELTNESNTGPRPAAGIGRANINGTGATNGFVPTEAGAVAVDGGHIYWTEPKSDAIGRSDLAGTNVNNEFITGADNPQGIAVDAGHVYWTNEGSDTIGRSELNGGGVQQNFISGASQPRGIAVGGGFIYWTNIGSTDIGRAEVSGANPNAAFITRSAEEVPGGIAVNATNLFWAADEGGVRKVIKTDLTGGSETSTNTLGARDVAVDGTYVYWSNEFLGRVSRMTLSLTNKENTFMTELEGIRGIAVDAGHVYWTLAPEQSFIPGKDLYSYDAESGELADLTADNGSENGAEVLGTIGASDDGSRVYFVANGDLDGGGPAKHGECSVEPQGRSLFGPCSVYLWDEGVTSFVTRIVGNEGSRNLVLHADAYEGEEMPTGFVSADGATMIFKSGLKLTSYENEGTPMYYRYHIGDPSLTCVTCSPTGAAPIYGPALYSAETSTERTITQPYRMRNMSADGNRFFFESSDKLVPTDINGDEKCPISPAATLGGPRCQDVYEWEAGGTGSCTNPHGCFYLLSTGEGEDPVFLSDASRTGDDAFIFSFQSLVPQDRDNLVDIYDVSTQGGMPSQHPVALPKCEGDGCRGEKSQTPPVNGAGSAVFEGPGDPTPKHKCEKGQVRRHGECVEKKKKKHHKKHKKHQRHENTTRRTSR